MDRRGRRRRPAAPQRWSTTARCPTASGSIDLVVAPHEFFELSDRPKADLQRAAAVSVCVCTEQPGTPWFHLSVDACRRGLASLDINPHGVDALRAVGVDARHLQLGAVPSIVHAPDRRRGRSTCCSWAGSTTGAVQRWRSWRRGCTVAVTELRLFRFDRPITARHARRAVRRRQVPSCCRRRDSCSTCIATGRCTCRREPWRRPTSSGRA